MHGEVELSGKLLCLRLPKKSGSAFAVIRGPLGDGVIILHSKQEAIDWLIRYTEGLEPQLVLRVIKQLEESMLADEPDPGKPTLEVKGVAGLLLSHSIGTAVRTPLHPVMDKRHLWWSFDHSMNTQSPTQMVVLLKVAGSVEVHVLYSQEQANELSTRLIMMGQIRTAQRIIIGSHRLPERSTIQSQVFDGFPAEFITAGAELKHSGFNMKDLLANGDA